MRIISVVMFILYSLWKKERHYFAEENTGYHGTDTEVSCASRIEKTISKETKFCRRSQKTIDNVELDKLGFSKIGDRIRLREALKVVDKVNKVLLYD